MGAADGFYPMGGFDYLGTAGFGYYRGALDGPFPVPTGYSSIYLNLLA